MTPLESKIVRLRKLYELGEPQCSDAEYDAFIEELRREQPDSPVLLQVGDEATARPTRHAVPMLSLDKVYDSVELMHWARGTGASTFAVMPKYDGVAVSLCVSVMHAVTALTRGDGTTGENISQHIPHMGGATRLALDLRARLGPVEIRGEAIMPRRRFAKRYASKYANARNLVAGALGRSEPDPAILDDIDFVPYSLVGHDMEDLRGTDVHFAKSVEAIPQVLARVLELVRSEDFPYECDGVVVRVAHEAEYAKLGATAHHPRGAIAFKLQGESGTTKLQTVEWQTSRTGTITPVAVVAAVALSGVTITRVTLHHFGRFQMLAPRVGDTVEVTRRGGVIPHIERVVERGRASGTVPAPSTCPSCATTRLAIDGDFLVCENPACPAKLCGRLEHWAKVTGMLGWGPELIARAVEGGALASFADFYRHTPRTLSGMADISPGVAKNLVAEAERTATMAPATFVAALGIDGIGATQAQRLVDRFGTVPALLAWASSTQRIFPAIPSLGPLTLGRVAHYLKQNMIEVRATLFVVRLEDTKPAVGPLAGERVVFTGAMVDMEREEARALVRQLGGEAPDSVTMQTTWLIVGDEAKDAQRTKRDKAERYNAKGARIEVITEVEFIRRVSRAQQEIEK